MTISVIHIKDFKRLPNQVYCGRANRRLGLEGSPLANPRVLYSEENRDACVDYYNDYFDRLIKGEDLGPHLEHKRREVLEELSRLEKVLAKEGVLELACFCSPKRCHCDKIKAYLEDSYELRRSTTSP